MYCPRGLEGVGRNLGIIVVRVCEPVFQNLHHSYTWALKKRTHSYTWYLIIQNVDLFIYCPLIFCTRLLLVVRQISQLVLWIPREQAASKNLCAYTRMSEKWGLSHRNPEKSGHSYTFCWKKEGQSYTWQRHHRGIAMKYATQIQYLCVNYRIKTWLANKYQTPG